MKDGTTIDTTGETVSETQPETTPASVAAQVAASVAGTVPLQPRRPRARKPAPSAAAVGLPVGPFGAVPRDATHWQARRRTVNGEWEACGYVPEGGIAELREFPLSQLSEQTLLDRWGPGTFDVSWVRPKSNGGRNVFRGTREIRIVSPVSSPAPVAAPAPAPSIGGLGEPFSLAMQIMQMIDGQSQSKLEAQVQMAQMFAGANRGGLGAAELQLILQSNQQATAAAVSAAVAPLTERIAQLEEEDDDDDEGGAAVVQAAAGVARRTVFKGGTMASVMNFAQENPGVAKSVVEGLAPVLQSAIGGIVTALGSLAQKKEAAPASVAPPPPPRPRAVPPMIGNFTEPNRTNGAAVAVEPSSA